MEPVLIRISEGDVGLGSILYRNVLNEGTDAHSVLNPTLCNLLHKMNCVIFYFFFQSHSFT